MLAHPINGPKTIEQNPLISDWMLKQYFAFKKHPGPEPFPMPKGGSQRMRKRLKVALRDGFKCKICGMDCAPDVGTIDHVIPLSKGGEDSFENQQWAHRLCNVRKGDKMPGELTDPEAEPLAEPEEYRVPFEARREIAIDLIRADYIDAAVYVLRRRGVFTAPYRERTEEPDAS
jgi:hypothetical protein